MNASARRARGGREARGAAKATTDPSVNPKASSGNVAKKDTPTQDHTQDPGHVTDDAPCWCDPELLDGGAIVVHRGAQ